MSDLQRLQQLAEAVGWKIERGIGNYVLTTNTRTGIHSSLAPIAARLEAEYRKLAEDGQRCLDVAIAAGFWHGDLRTLIKQYSEVADSLAVKEPTMVKGDVEQLRKMSTDCAFNYADRVTARVLLHLLDAIERKEK